MSVRTTADENKDLAKEHIEWAINALSEIIIKKCHGSDDFRDEYKKVLKDSLFNLIEMREKL